MPGRKPDRPRLTVRFDQDIYDALKRRAEKGNRAINRQVMQDLKVVQEKEEE